MPKRGRSRAGHALVAVRASPVVDIDHDTMNRPGLLGTRATIVGVSMVSAEREVQLPPLPLPGAMPREVRGRCGPSTGTSSTATIRRRAEAGRSLDLAGVHDTVEHWRMRSWIARDKQEHRRVVRRAIALSRCSLVRSRLLANL